MYTILRANKIPLFTHISTACREKAAKTGFRCRVPYSQFSNSEIAVGWRTQLVSRMRLRSCHSWQLGTLHCPESIWVQAKQGIVLDLQVCNMPIDQSSLEWLDKKQDNRHYPPFIGTPTLEAEGATKNQNRSACNQYLNSIKMLSLQVRKESNLLVLDAWAEEAAKEDSPEYIAPQMTATICRAVRHINL